MRACLCFTIDNTTVENLRAMCLDHAKLGENSLSPSLDSRFFGPSPSQVLYLIEVQLHLKCIQWQWLHKLYSIKTINVKYSCQLNMSMICMPYCWFCQGHHNLARAPSLKGLIVSDPVWVKILGLCIQCNIFNGFHLYNLSWETNLHESVVGIRKTAYFSVRYSKS